MDVTKPAQNAEGQLLSVVTTIYRTGHCIEEFHRRCEAAAARMGCSLELVLVNDGSPDNGLAIATDLAGRDDRVVVIDLSHNFGQHRALWAGLERASGDLVAIMDGDLDEDPAWLAEFYQEMQREKCDVVYGVEKVAKRAGIYRLARRSFYFALRLLSEARFPENVVTARLMTRRYVESLLSFGEREIYLAGLLWVTGYKQVAMDVFRARKEPTKYSIARLSRLFLSSVTSFSTRPLIAIFVVGMIICALSFVYLAVLVLQKIFFGIEVLGWASVMGAVLLLSGMTIMFNGVMAIYIATIFLEVKRRPRVIVRDVIGGHARNKIVGDTAMRSAVTSTNSLRANVE